jgi:hypothetical protein
MYPFVGLRLTEAKQIPLNFLRRILTEVHQNEQQFVAQFSSSGLRPAP